MIYLSLWQNNWTKRGLFALFAEITRYFITEHARFLGLLTLIFIERHRKAFSTYVFLLFLDAGKRRNIHS